MTRIRLAFLEGLGSALRQNILLSAYPFAELNALFHRQCSSASGRARLKHQHQVRCDQLACLLLHPTSATCSASYVPLIAIVLEDLRCYD